MQINLIAACKYNVHCTQRLIEKSREILIGEVGTRESGFNTGDVEKYQRVLNLPKHSPYCAAGQYYCFYQAAKLLKYSFDSVPLYPSGLCREMYYRTIKKGYKTKFNAQDNDLIFWKSVSGINGHTERIIKTMKKGLVQTIGFNTSDSNKNQSEGGGVFIKKRNIYGYLGRMRVLGLIGFN